MMMMQKNLFGRAKRSSLPSSAPHCHFWGQVWMDGWLDGWTRRQTTIFFFFCLIVTMIEGGNEEK